MVSTPEDFDEESEYYVCRNVHEKMKNIRLPRKKKVNTVAANPRGDNNDNNGRFTQ